MDLPLEEAQAPQVNICLTSQQQDTSKKKKNKKKLIKEKYSNEELH